MNIRTTFNKFFSTVAPSKCIEIEKYGLHICFTLTNY